VTVRYLFATRFYDAPLHVKALNGMMLIDDFGRQKFAPNDLLNRWIVPMENQVDFMKLCLPRVMRAEVFGLYASFDEAKNARLVIIDHVEFS